MLKKIKTLLLLLLCRGWWFYTMLFVILGQNVKDNTPQGQVYIAFFMIVILFTAINDASCRTAEEFGSSGSFTI